MKKKRVVAWMLASGMMMSAMSGSITGMAAEESSGSVPAFEDIEFPESLPSKMTQAEENYYDYDDMSQHYDLEFFTMNYGVTVPENDPIKAWLEEKYNVSITLTTCLQDDVENILSTRFSSGDVPDLFFLPSSDYGFTLGEQGLLVDAKEMYPYLPQTCKFVTQTMLDWSTMDDGTIPFITRYAIQDGDIWNLAIREDWLNNLNMEMPKTMDELKEYARAVTEDDPDGNGQADTYFMLGAGGGKSFSMLNAFQPFFGNPSEHVEDGVLVSPMLDGTTKGWVGFLNELYEMGTLAPDWFTIDWETAKSYTMNDKIGMVNYPADALYWEYENAKNQDPTSANNWTFLPSLPEGTKGNPGGNPGNLFAVSAANVKDDQGKLLRILHIFDTMTYGGESFLETIQGGGNEVHDGFYGEREYLDDGRFVCQVNEDHPGYTVYGSDNLALAPWQTFGYTTKYLASVCDDDDKNKNVYDRINEAQKSTMSYDRWPNDSLLVTVSGDIAPNLGEYETSEFYKFVVGERSMDEWDTFVGEWLDQGGRDVLTAKAEKLGVALPEEAK